MTGLYLLTFVNCGGGGDAAGNLLYFSFFTDIVDINVWETHTVVP